MMLDQETLVWYSADAPPDVDTTVLIYSPESDEPVWLGYFSGKDDIWCDASGAAYSTHVAAWAQMPAGAVCAEAPVWP